MFLVDFELPAAQHKNSLTETHAPKQNQILAALPPKVCERLLPNLKLVSLKPGMMLHEASSLLRHVYFPIDAVISLLEITDHGMPAEIAMIGHEGMSGIFWSLGGKSMPSRIVVQRAGYAYRLDVNALERELAFGNPLQQALLRYTLALNTAILQGIACKRQHSLEQQLCRWLLSRLDRSPANDISIPLELAANMLGASREHVAEAAARLQADGLLSCSGGHLSVPDRTRLEARTCNCYALIRQGFEQALPTRVPG